MTDRRDLGADGGPQILAWAAGIGLLVVGWSLYLTPHEWATLFPRDLPVYQAAIDAFSTGGDPYRPAQAHHAHGLFFTAPPFVWELYKLAAHSVLKPIFATVLLTADAVSVVVLPLVLSWLLLGRGLGRIVLGTGFFFIGFAGAGFFTAMVINNGTPLYALIAVALIPAMAKDRWWPFHLAVVLATAFKPFYAAFWLVPLFADGLGSRRQWGPSAAGLAIAAMTYLAPALLAPKLFSTWVHTLTKQTVGEGLLGQNLLGAVFHEPYARQAPLAPYEAQLALSAALVAASLMLGRLTRPQRIAGLLLAAVMLNPRAMRYDLSMAAIPLLAVAASLFQRGPPSATVQAVWAVVLATAMTLANQNNASFDGYLYPAIAVLALLGAAASGQSGRRT